MLRKPRTPANARDGPKALLYARGLHIALIGNAVAGFFLSEAYSATIWMTVAVCTAFVRVATNESIAATSEAIVEMRKSRALKRALRMTRSAKAGGRRER